MSKYSSRDLVVTIVNNAVNKTITDLHISTVITKTLSGLPNIAELQIYNLNRNSREDLYNNVYNYTENIGITKITISLDGNVLFQGDLINVNSLYRKLEAEWVTSLYCGDGYNAFRETVTKRYDAGISRKDIVLDLVSTLESTGVATRGLISDIKGCTDKSILKSIIVNGEIVKNIKDLLSNCLGGTSNSEDVYIDDGKINIQNKNEAIDNIVITNKDLLDPPTLTEQGINCKLLLNAQLKIGGKFEVQSKSNNIAFGNLSTYRVQKVRISGTGTYKVQELKYIVDNFSDEVATVEVIGLNLLRVQNANQ